MTTSHTPGPWTIGNAHGAARDHAICADHQVIARVTGSGYPIGEGWSAETAANARLIAAAPDMLAALAAINAALTQPVQFSGTDAPGTSNILRGDCQVAAAYARAAIAKATGGTDR